MIRIKIANPYEQEVDFAALKTATKAVLEGEGVPEAKVTIALVDNAHIHRLNKQFLDHDEPTDVLTFPYSDPSAKQVEGEIVVGFEIAREYAADRGHAPAQELILYVVHGCLHLCGYDDKTDAAETEMREQEHHYLQLLGLPNISGK